MKLRILGRFLKLIAIGARLNRALERHNRAANDLDAAVKEMLEK